MKNLLSIFAIAAIFGLIAGNLYAQWDCSYGWCQDNPTSMPGIVEAEDIAGYFPNCTYDIYWGCACYYKACDQAYLCHGSYQEYCWDNGPAGSCSC